MQALCQEVEQCLMEENQPSASLRTFVERGKFDVFPLGMLLRQQFTEQSPIHHPEGNVWNHTMLVVDYAAQLKSESSDARAFMWAALLHDIGKPDTTKKHKGKITAYDHDKVGAKLAEEFLSSLMDDKEFITRVTNLVRYHMQILYVLKNLSFQDIKGMKEHVNIKDIALLGLCDRLGRTGSDRAAEEKNMELFLQKCKDFRQTTRD